MILVCSATLLETIDATDRFYDYNFGNIFLFIHACDFRGRVSLGLGFL